MQQRVTQATTVHDNNVYDVERVKSCKVPWLVVGPGGVCSVAHKLSVESVDNCGGDGKLSTQVLVRPATQLCLGRCAPKPDDAAMFRCQIAAYQHCSSVAANQYMKGAQPMI